jgi:hypothetical protein
VADLRAGGVGVQRVLFAHDGTRAGRDVFEWLLTMLAADVDLGVVPVFSARVSGDEARDAIEADRQWAEQLGRRLNVLADRPQGGSDIVRLAGEGHYDAIVLHTFGKEGTAANADENEWMNCVLQNATCGVFIATHPAIPREIVG